MHNVGDVVADMHGRNAKDLLSMGLQVCCWVSDDYKDMEVVEVFTLPLSHISELIQKNIPHTAWGYVNKDLVVLGEDYTGGIIAGYSYDGTHGGFVRLKQKSTS
jgi:hypothetical protein|tara:strand:- start:833 stop:1144 length:312 start_codon:yes stop_codon:yes gene_type:complete